MVKRTGGALLLSLNIDRTPGTIGNQLYAAIRDLIHTGGLNPGVFQSLIELQAAINRFIEEHNASDAKPFVWKADPDKIIAARNRGFQTLESVR